MVFFKVIVLIFVIFSSDIFFVLSSLLGYNYGGSESSPVYIIYSVLVFLLGILLFLNEIIFKKSKISKTQLFMLFLPFIFLIMNLFSNARHGINTIAVQYYLYFILWGFPSILAGIIISKKQHFLTGLIKYLDIYMIFITLTVSVSSYNFLLLGSSFTSLGGATYQTASYLAAFSFGLNLYYLNWDDDVNRINFFKNKTYKYFSYSLLVIQILSALFTGGRGGMILIGIYLLLYSTNFYYRKSIKFNNILTTIFTLTIIIVLLISIVPRLVEIPVFNSSLNRTFEYLSPVAGDGVSLRRTMYLNEINLIKESPIVGYGFYGIWNVTGYPHNFFLEILLQGGVVYLALVISLLMYLFYKLKKIIEFNKKNFLILIILLYPFTLLMFSGTYTIHSIFWFSISYILSYKI